MYRHKISHYSRTNIKLMNTICLRWNNKCVAYKCACICVCVNASIYSTDETSTTVTKNAVLKIQIRADVTNARVPLYAINRRYAEVGRTAPTLAEVFEREVRRAF